MNPYMKSQPVTSVTNPYLKKKEVLDTKSPSELNATGKNTIPLEKSSDVDKRFVISSKDSVKINNPAGDYLSKQGINLETLKDKQLSNKENQGKDSKPPVPSHSTQSRNVNEFQNALSLQIPKEIKKLKPTSPLAYSSSNPAPDDRNATISDSNSSIGSDFEGFLTKNAVGNKSTVKETNLNTSIPRASIGTSSRISITENASHLSSLIPHRPSFGKIKDFSEIDHTTDDESIESIPETIQTKLKSSSFNNLTHIKQNHHSSTSSLTKSSLTKSTSTFSNPNLISKPKSNSTNLLTQIANNRMQQNDKIDNLNTKLSKNNLTSIDTKLNSRLDLTKRSTENMKSNPVLNKTEQILKFHQSQMNLNDIGPMGLNAEDGMRNGKPLLSGSQNLASQPQHSSTYGLNGTTPHSYTPSGVNAPQPFVSTNGMNGYIPSMTPQAAYTPHGMTQMYAPPPMIPYGFYLPFSPVPTPQPQPHCQCCKSKHEKRPTSRGRKPKRHSTTSDQDLQSNDDNESKKSTNLKPKEKSNQSDTESSLPTPPVDPNFTKYSNMNTIIIDNFIQQHMKLLAEFVDMNRNLLDSHVVHRQPSVTLENTREFIRKNRKPELSLEEALKLVQQELEPY
ncbi:hypothetical protein BC833DRAFT_564385 [Globomyces pollinis-pini]|nr:hypothetical protein BC833DRAFT_564385 [Globomyces pollinis-pini]